MRIIVHGGAGRLAGERREACRRGCRAAAEVGWRVLCDGGSALDAVEAAVIALENDPEFNAGTGSALRADGRVQMDASIMDGTTLDAGAVAIVERIKNPVRLARRVLAEGRHVLLAGADAEVFARAEGIEFCDPSHLVVPHQRRHWEHSHGTVGAVALDGNGRLAAATSTGGRSGALPGRIGDSPLVGCGVYADKSSGVSCTGIGESIIKTVLAKAAADRVAAGAAAQTAADEAIRYYRERVSGDAGLILIDAAGGVGFARCAPAMPVAWIGDDGECHTES